jgi:acetyl esterase
MTSNDGDAVMGRAQELLPINRAEPMVLEGVPLLTDDMRAALDISQRYAPVAGAPNVRMIVYRPKAESGRLPVLLSLHGGAFCLLSADDFEGVDAGIALANRAVVIAVDYRLAPEHPFPAGPDDCYAALEWTVASADELGVDLDHLVVAGGSAGGALTAAVCQMARDRSGPRIAAQVLMIPVLDDRLATASMRQHAQSIGFSGTAAEGMWLHYLGEDRDVATTSPYAAPARAESLAGLPPAVVLTHGNDPLRDEGIEYAMRLMAEGIPVELHNIPGAYHGAPPDDPVAYQRGVGVYAAALSQALRPG